MLCYNPIQNITKEEIDRYFAQIASSSLIIGDFNAKHKLRNPNLLNTQCNVSGKSLTASLIPHARF